MEKSSRRSSISQSQPHSHSRPLSNATTDARPNSTATDDDLPKARPVSTATTNANGITVLTDDELARVRRALGATRPRPYSTAPTSSTIWPPRRLPTGLYRDVVRSRCGAQYFYYFLATLYNICIVLQLLLGATLTALGSTSSKHSVAITIIAAANTVNAGVIALLHNSGLPDRIRNDWNTFAAVELQLIEMLNTGIIQPSLPEKGDVVANAIAFAFTLYTNANLTVQNNKPASYVSSSGNAKGHGGSKHSAGLAY